MKRKTEYIIEEEVALAIKKVTGEITDTDFKNKYKLTENEMNLIHRFYDLVEDKEDN